MNPGYHNGGLGFGGQQTHGRDFSGSRLRNYDFFHWPGWKFARIIY